MYKSQKRKSQKRKSQKRKSQKRKSQQKNNFLLSREVTTRRPSTKIDSKENTIPFKNLILTTDQGKDMTERLTKYFIILGSGYNYKHEYNIPLNIDPNAYWVVFSIDKSYLSEFNENDNLITEHCEIHRIQKNIENILDIKKIAEIEKSIIYIMDSISCGFVSNAAKNLVKYFLPYNRVFFLHYISPYMEHPSISLTDYTEEERDVIFKQCYLNEKEMKAAKNIIKSISNPSIEKLTEYPFLNRVGIYKFKDCVKPLFTEIDLLQKINFVEVVDENTDITTLPYSKSCDITQGMDKFIDFSKDPRYLKYSK